MFLSIKKNYGLHFNQNCHIQGFFFWLNSKLAKVFQVVRYLFLILPIYIQIEFVDEDGKIVFQDGSSVHADTILYCTGYESNASLFIVFSLHLASSA